MSCEKCNYDCDQGSQVLRPCAGRPLVLVDRCGGGHLLHRLGSGSAGCLGSGWLVGVGQASLKVWTSFA